MFLVSIVSFYIKVNVITISTYPIKEFFSEKNERSKFKKKITTDKDKIR